MDWVGLVFKVSLIGLEILNPKRLGWVENTSSPIQTDLIQPLLAPLMPKKQKLL
jgi:hypothetical protein